MDRLEDSQTPGCLGEQEASRGVVDTSRPPFEWGRNVEILSQHKHSRHCPQKKPDLKGSGGSCPRSLFSWDVGSPVSTLAPQFYLAPQRPFREDYLCSPDSQEVLTLQATSPPLRKPSLAFCKSILSVLHSRCPVFKNSQQPLRKG